MIRFFNVNDPYRLIVVLLVMTAGGFVAHGLLDQATIPELKGMLVGEMLRDGKPLYAEVWDSTPPLSAWFHRLMFSLAGKNLGLRHAVTVLIFFLQAAFFGIMLIRNRAFDQTGYFPSFLFGLLLFYSIDTIAFTREVWASSFLLLALDRVLRQIQFRDQQESHLNVLGILIGVASLFDFTYAVFFPGILMILIVTSRMDQGRIVLYTLGFLFPHLALITWYYLEGNLSNLLVLFYGYSFRFTTQSYFSLAGLLMLSTLPAIYLLFGMLKGRSSVSRTKYQSQIAVVMVIWLVTGAVEAWLTRQRSAQVLVVCIPPVAYFIHDFLLRVRRTWLAGLMAWVLIAGVPATAVIAFQGRLPYVDYTRTFIGQNDQQHAGKKLLVLSDDLRLYRGGGAAAFFPEWELAQDLFRHPDYYENIVILNRAFGTDPPDIIIDPENLMPAIFRLLPGLARQYVRDGQEYRRI